MRIAITGASGFCGSAVARAAAGPGRPPDGPFPGGRETPDRETPDRETPDLETPDRETPDLETPDRETPDRETPDRETPDRQAHGREAHGRETPGWEVVCLGRRPGPVGEHRVWDATRERPDLSGVDAVIHLAAAVGDPRPGPAAEEHFRAVNVDGTRRLLAAAGDRPVVWVSSASVYRPGPYRRPVTEDHPADRQRTAYGRTKAEGERLALDAGAVVLRPRAVYGPGDPHLEPRLRRVVRGGRAWLPGPDVRLSLTAVGNLADACRAALTWPPGAYNIADATPYSRDAAVSAVLRVPVRHVPLAAAEAAVRLGSRLLTRYALDQVTDGLVLDLGRARRQGWAPRLSLWSWAASGRQSTPRSRPRRSW